MVENQGGSLPGSVDSKDLIKVGKGALLAAAGAVGAYVLSNVVPLLESSGVEWKLFLAAVIPVVINFGRKWLFDNSKQG